MTTKKVLALLAARGPMTPAESHAQLVSLTFGNLGLEYPNLRREQIEEAARKRAANRR